MCPLLSTGSHASLDALHRPQPLMYLLYDQSAVLACTAASCFVAGMMPGGCQIGALECHQYEFWPADNEQCGVSAQRRFAGKVKDLAAHGPARRLAEIPSDSNRPELKANKKGTQSKSQ